jgi:hypothetical protein
MTLLYRALPYIISACLVLGAFYGVFLFGRSVEHDELTAQYEKKLRAIDQANLAAMTKHQAQWEANLRVALEAERRNLERQRVTETVFKTITEKVVEYVQANPSADVCSLDADGLRLWNDANGGAVSADAGGGGGPDGALPISTSGW